MNKIKVMKLCKKCIPYANLYIHYMEFGETVVCGLRPVKDGLIRSYMNALKSKFTHKNQSK